MPSKSRLLSSTVNKPSSLIGASLSNPSEVNLQALETAAVKYTASSQLPSTGNIGEQAFVEETNRLYIWNGSGWYNIALINTTPTWDSNGQPASSYVLSADSPQTATTITLAATDPEGIPVSYNYVTGGSMDSIATISQDSSVFTITPKTSVQVPDGGTGSITFRATDGVNILPQVSSFTLNFISTITNSKYTTLLATATGTSDNNNITDASSNSHSITVNGDAHAGTFSPYRGGGYSTFFDGTGDYLRTPTINLSGNFTIEFFVSLDEVTTDVGIFSFGTLNSTNSILELYNYTNGQFRLYSSSGGDLGNSSAAEANKWYHVAITRSGNTFKAYLDGVEFADDTTARTINSAITIGGYVNTSLLMSGYIRDFRITTNVEYPSNNFTPPSEPLTAITGTVLLTCHLPYFADGSTNDHSITANGSVSTKPFSPYDYEEYSATDNGGSVYFDTSDDYLTVPNGSWKTYGSSNFTIECWFYADRDGMLWGDSSTSGFGDNCTVIAELKNFSSSATAWVQVEFRVGSTKYGINPAQGTFKRNAWNHIAFVRNGNTFTVYSNGKDVGNTSQSGSMNTSSNDWAIASGWPSSTGTQFNGYISDFRVSKSARYTAEFTPPIAPLSSTNAELHLKGTDASIIDKSQSANLKLVGNTTGSTTQVKFAGTKSMYFDGNQDMTHSVLPAPLASQATIEFWMYSSATNKRFVFGIGIYEVSSFLGIDTYDGIFRVRATSGTSGSTTQIIADVAYSANTWYHVAIVRDGTTYELYVDGISKGTGTYGAENTYDSSYDVTIGTLSVDGTSTANPWSGYIQDFRITNGLARYTANFTPPTAPLEG